MITLFALLASSACLAQDGEPTPVIKVPGKATSAMRPYSRFLPGIREFQLHHELAPEAELRFGLVTSGFPMKPLPLERASLETTGGWFSEAWSQDVTVLPEGWFTLPDSPEAEQRGASLYVSHRRSDSAKWMLDIHTPGLPPHIYRLGDLRLECRVYLAIEWALWKGKQVMAQPASGVTSPPMDRLCGGPDAIFFNTRPWPRLQAYTVSEDGRSRSHELNGHRISISSFMLKLNKPDSAPAWSDDAHVEFVFYDNSHWTTATPATPPQP